MELSRNQKHVSVIVKNKKSKYKFTFKLDITDVAKSSMWLFKKSFDFFMDPQFDDMTLLWVVTIRKPHHNQKTIKVEDLDWHYSTVETNKEITCKHKGIISKLSHSDALLAAGELYVKDKVIYWNTSSGHLKRNMLHNETLMGEKFSDFVMAPIFKYQRVKTKYQECIMKCTAPEITYEYCNRLYKDKSVSYVRKKKIR